MKTLFMCLCALTITVAVQAQTNQEECPDKEWFLEVKDFLDKQHVRQSVKDMRKWAREMKLPQYEDASNKLEYWVKDMSRYIDKYLDSHFDAVCKRVMIDERDYFKDILLVDFDRYSWIDLENYEPK